MSGFPRNSICFWIPSIPLPMPNLMRRMTLRRFHTSPFIHVCDSCKSISREGVPRPRCPTPRLPYVVHNGLSIRSVGDLSHFLTVSLYLTLIDTEYLNPVLHLYPPQQPLPLQLPPMLPEQSLPMLPISSRPEIQFLRYALCMLTAFFLAVTPPFCCYFLCFFSFSFCFCCLFDSSCRHYLSSFSYRFSNDSDPVLFSAPPE